MTRRPTIQDLAKAAGLGVATVDRVLNGRPNVSDRSIREVSEAAARIGFISPRLEPQAQRAARRVVRFGFVLHKRGQEFYQNFASELERAVAARTDIRGEVTFRFASSQAPGDFVRELIEVAEVSDVIASSALNHGQIDAEVKRISDRGIPVYALLNDFAQGSRHGYFGLNNIKVGRIAAWLIATQTAGKGKAAVFVGGNRWHGHVLRETGFHAYMREFAPDMALLNTMVNLETRQLTYAATHELLERHPDLTGLYVAGGGMEGAIAAVREARAPGAVALVVNELTADSRLGLGDRVVSLCIATPLERLCRELIDRMIAEPLTQGATGQRFFEPDLVSPESV
ncbi:LacI family DNA-binding transcriptional regulator [Pseudoprimorskyibacter insulae]|uniref:HTH lacI-type domain-containing protein n=1 Tax=Pseudoprimorskyibacter insulae TaxID=1695997 RepID=A0A2R8B1G6_9RHOB|nr:LacI family DNA-binding transcriptional regulator [Pseudoprimorskyibacter insulae]SPF81969.1 hypothetical protein PRI8871_03797 [Pseudoprimorskyibacter insulae]